jgi:hypothetical protein
MITNIEFRATALACTCAELNSPHRSQTYSLDVTLNPIGMAFIDDSEQAGANDGASTSGQTPMDIDTVRTRPGTRSQMEKLCPRCGEWIGLGAKGSEYPFLAHQDGNRCRRLTELRGTARAPTEARESFVTSSSFALGPLSLLSPSPMAVSPNIPASEPFLDDPSPHSHDLPSMRAVPTSEIPALASFPPPSPLSPLPSITKVPCHGAPVKWEHGCPARTYPFHYHSTDRLPWSVTIQHSPDPTVILLRSLSCSNFHDPSTNACSKCLQVPVSKKYQSLVLNTSKDPAPTTQLETLSREQLLQRLKDRNDECCKLRRKVSFCSCALNLVLM